MENKIKESNEYEEMLKQRIKDIEEKNKEEIEKLKQHLKNIYKTKTEELQREIEKKYQREIFEMEERYIDTFRNMNEIKQPQWREERPPRQCTEIAKPTFFRNNKDQHPKDFIREQREYFVLK
jgi:hypothetical protein